MPDVNGPCLWKWRDGSCHIDGRKCCGIGGSCGFFVEKGPEDPYPEDRPPVDDDY